MNSRQSIVEVHTEADFKALKDEWNALVDADSRATIFQTWEFQYHTWRIFSDSVALNLLLVRDEREHLIGWNVET